METLNGTNNMNVIEVINANEVVFDKPIQFDTKKEALNYDNYAKYSIVLINESNNGKCTVLNFGRLSKLETRNALKEILKYVISDSIVSVDYINKGHKEVTGKSNKELIRPFLKGRKIYMVDGKGKITNNVIESEIPLKQTALNVSPKCDLVNIKITNPEIRAAMLNNYINAVLWQFRKVAFFKETVLDVSQAVDKIEVNETETVNENALTVNSAAIA